MSHPTPPPNHTPAATAAAEVIHQQTHPWMAGPCTECTRLGYLIVDKLTSNNGASLPDETITEQQSGPLAVLTAGRIFVFEAIGKFDADALQRDQHLPVDMRTYMEAGVPPIFVAFILRDCADGLRDAFFEQCAAEVRGE